MEIGSVYEIDPKSVEMTKNDSVVSLNLREVEKYGKENTVYTASGREAISLALQSMEKEIFGLKKKCLMPAYMCDTVFIPFRQQNWELVFYPIDRNMKADMKVLQKLVQEEKPGLLFIHDYYGVDTWKEERCVLADWQKAGLLIMEDVTQAYYLDVKTHADFVIGSLRKWYAIPDGGFVTSNYPLNKEIMVLNDTFARERLQMLIKKWNYLNATHLQQTHLQKMSLQKEKEEYLQQNRELEQRLDAYERVTELSAVSGYVLSSMDEEECKKRRIANARILQDGLKTRKILTPVFAELPAETAPLYFPVYMENREDLQNYLREQDIYVPVLWPIGKENETCLSEDEKYIYSHIAAIPMDQRYGEEEMKRIVDVLGDFYAI